jgi:hypothetical protein
VIRFPQALHLGEILGLVGGGAGDDPAGLVEIAAVAVGLALVGQLDHPALGLGQVEPETQVVGLAQARHAFVLGG